MWRAAAASLQRGGGLAARPWLPAATRTPGVPPTEAPGLLAPLQVRWAKKGKRKKRAKVADKTAELKAAGGGPNLRLADYYMETETPYKMALNINKHMRGLTSDGRHNNRRKKDLTRYSHYRVLRLAGLTHDDPDPEEDVDRRGFVSPLTRLQHEAALPRSPLHRRFSFPHVLNYKVYWGPPTVQDEPNAYEGSMVGCSVAVRLGDLPLTQRQKERLVDIVGHNRFDEATGVVALETDNFQDRNQNAALLGDMLDQLMREVTAPEETE